MVRWGRCERQNLKNRFFWNSIFSCCFWRNSWFFSVVFQKKSGISFFCRSHMNHRTTVYLSVWINSIYLNSYHDVLVFNCKTDKDVYVFTIRCWLSYIIWNRDMVFLFYPSTHFWLSSPAIYVVFLKRMLICIRQLLMRMLATIFGDRNHSAVGKYDLHGIISNTLYSMKKCTS